LQSEPRGVGALPQRFGRTLSAIMRPRCSRILAIVPALLAVACVSPPRRPSSQLVLDHLFIMVQPGAPERAALEEAAVAAVDTLLREGAREQRSGRELCAGSLSSRRRIARFKWQI